MAQPSPSPAVTLVTIMLFREGVQLTGIGVPGEYFGRGYDEVKRRHSRGDGNTSRDRIT